MADVIAHDIAHEETSQEYADHRIKQIEAVGLCDIKILRQESLDEVDNPF